MLNQMKKYKSIIQYPGAKWRMAKNIIPLIPNHKVYMEPFFGSGAVFFNKKPCRLETINDLDDRVINLFKVCRESPEELANAIALTPYARKEFENIEEDVAGTDIKQTDDEIENARRFVIRCSMAFGGKLSDITGWKNSKSATSPNNPGLWNQIPNRILQITERLKQAQIECRPAIELIKQYNHQECLIYADPPYLKSTRPKRLYFKEMMDEDEHIKLLETLLQHKGSAVISGYDSDLYNSMLKNWKCFIFQERNNNGNKCVEKLWIKEWN